MHQVRKISLQMYISMRNHLTPSLSIQEVITDDGFKRLSIGDDSLMTLNSINLADSLGATSSKMKNHFEPEESDETLDLLNQMLFDISQ